MLRTLRPGPFKFLLAGQGLSQFGDTLLYVGGLWFLQTVSPWLLGVAGLVMAAPAAISYLGGGLADRIGARELMWRTDLVRGAVIVGCAVGVIVLPAAGVILVLLGLAVTSLGNALFTPSQLALLPRLFSSSQDLTAGNSILNGTSRLADTLGRVAGTAALLAIRLVGLFAVDAVTFFASALFVRRVPKDERAADVSPRGRRHAWSDLRQGFAYSRRLGWFFKIVPPVIVINLALSGGMITLPILVQRTLHASAPTYGVLLAMWSLGQFAGSFSAVLVRGKQPRAVCGTAALVQALALLGVAFGDTVFAAALGIGIAATANSMSNVARTTLMQRLIPAEARGRVFGLQGTLISVANPFAAFIAVRLALSLFPGFIWILVSLPTLWLSTLYWTLPGFRLATDDVDART